MKVHYVHEYMFAVLFSIILRLRLESRKFLVALPSHGLLDLNNIKKNLHTKEEKVWWFVFFSSNFAKVSLLILHIESSLQTRDVPTDCLPQLVPIQHTCASEYLFNIFSIFSLMLINQDIWLKYRIRQKQSLHQERKQALTGLPRRLSICLYLYWISARQLPNQVVTRNQCSQTSTVKFRRNNHMSFVPNVYNRIT